MLLDQGVGTDNDVCLARGQSRICLATLHTAKAACEQYHRQGTFEAPVLSMGHQFCYGPVVLFGQDLGGSHQG